MFGLGTWEIAIILLVALLVLGPDKLPQLARTIGKGLREIRRATSDLRMNLDIDDEPVRTRPVGQRAEPQPAALDPDPYRQAPPTTGSTEAGSPGDAGAPPPPPAPAQAPVEVSSSKPAAAAPDGDEGERA